MKWNTINQETRCYGNVIAETQKKDYIKKRVNNKIYGLSHLTLKSYAEKTIAKVLNQDIDVIISEFWYFQ